MNSYLSSSLKQFSYYQNLGSRTFSQLSDEDLFKEWGPDSNSIGVIVNHLRGNMLSRWTDFLTTDGEKPSRNRDSEFEQVIKTRAQLEEAWETGWGKVFNTINKLDDSDLDKVIYIRNQGHSVVEAINRQLCHYAYHVGQIVFIGKLAKGEEWESLSIPKNQSKHYNAEKFGAEKSIRHFTDDEMR